MYQEKARAKINLTLHVGRPIADQADKFYGYHPLDSLVLFSDIGDVLRCEESSQSHLIVTGPFATDVPCDESNLVLTAYALVSRKNKLPPLSFSLEKNLPVAAGIGGGSANAAAALRLFSHYVDLPDHIWLKYALRIGADVPVCWLSQTARMTGIGDTVRPITGLGQVFALLVNPGVAVMTAEVFRLLEHPKDTPRPSKTEGDLLTCALDGRNDLEPVASSIAPEIAACLRELASTPGCQLARMSGSGATCFGLYATQTESLRAAEHISQMYPKWWVKPVILGDP